MRKPVRRRIQDERSGIDLPIGGRYRLSGYRPHAHTHQLDSAHRPRCNRAPSDAIHATEAIPATRYLACNCRATAPADQRKNVNSLQKMVGLDTHAYSFSVKFEELCASVTLTGLNFLQCADLHGGRPKLKRSKMPRAKSYGRSMRTETMTPLRLPGTIERERR